MLSCGSALRFGPLGQVTGFDWQILFLAADTFGVSRLAIARLLPQLEAGMLRGMYGDGEGETEPAPDGPECMPVMTGGADHGG